MDTKMEDVVDANECMNERNNKRKCEYNADPIWSQWMRLTKSMLSAKRKRPRPYERKPRAKIDDKKRLLTIRPQLKYPQSYFSFHNIKNVGTQELGQGVGIVLILLTFKINDICTALIQED